MSHRQLAVAALVASALFSFRCGGSGEAPAGAAETPASDPAAESAAPAVNVTTMALEADSLVDELRLVGRLEPWVEVRISSELGGTVQGIGFDKGDRVRKDQELARIGTDLLEAALAEAEAELTAAEANYTKATELFERQAVPRQEVIAATSTFKRAQARVEQAKLRVARSIIRAPISGVAVSREIELGEVVPPGAVVTTLHQTSRLKADVGIPENDIAYFRVGGAATLEIDAYPEESFRGRIHFLGPAATGQNRTFPAEIEVDNGSGELRPGMIVRVALVRRVFEDAVVVPRDAILERDTGTVAFVLEDGRAVQRPVRTGPSHEGKIVVTEGLALGESLIVTGHRNLVDGQRVRVVDRSKASDDAERATS